MDELKSCSRCKTVYLKSNFYKDRTTNDGYRPSCKSCYRKYYYDNQSRILNNLKIYNKKNRSRINADERLKRKNDSKFNHCGKIRQMTNYAFKSQNNEKFINLIGCSNQFFRKGDSTNFSYKLYTITEVIHDTIPSYRIDYLPERYNENLLLPTKLSLEQNNQVMKDLNLIQ